MYTNEESSDTYINRGQLQEVTNVFQLGRMTPRNAMSHFIKLFPLNVSIAGLFCLLHSVSGVINTVNKL